MNGKYWVPLPFKNPDACFPDKKCWVMMKIKHSERKYARTPFFFEHFKTFVEYMTKKGLCRIIWANTWKWQVLVHPPIMVSIAWQKTDKISVVFDCKVEYKRTSINNWFGPNKSNQKDSIQGRCWSNDIPRKNTSWKKLHKVSVVEKQQH